MNLFNFTAQAATIQEKCVGDNCTPTLGGFETVVANFLGIVTGLGALLALAMLFVGGFKYIISRGDPKANDAARSTITWSITGLIFIIAAYLVIRLIASFTGVGIDTFKVPTGD